MGHVESFKDLEVYKMARQLAKRIFELTKTFPMEERYSLTGQIRRSSRSIGGQIAEAWGKRRYINHFISKLTDADGEQLETQHWIEVSFDCEYIDANVRKELNEKCYSIGKMLQKMIEKADDFCK
ncbi:MAG TPA: four helix bundle protein [Saprospiraceae bacterium]|nr:four helix bundle protein [Saprospiraceae bacterium]